MPIFRISASNTSFLTNGEDAVYAGKNGFTSTMGAIPALCNSFTANVSSIVFSVPNLHLLQDDNYNVHILDVPALEGFTSDYLKTPILQFPESTALEGSVGFVERETALSLAIDSYNIASNTITAFNRPYGDTVISSIFPTAPFYITLFQTLTTNNFSNRTAYITGSSKNVKRTYNVTGNTGSYTAALGFATSNRNEVKVYLDDIATDSFTWSGDNVTVTLLGDTTEVKTIVDRYTVPAFETGDLVSLSLFNNTYSISSTSYIPGDALYSADLTNNKFYKIKLNKAITANLTSVSIVNTSPDLEGKIANITSNSYTFDGRSDYGFTYKLANTGIYYIYEKNKVKYTTARIDEFGRLEGIGPAFYIVEATNVNRYNRVSSAVKSLVEVEPLRISKVSGITIDEQIFVDTTGGASININVTFPTLTGRDITAYELKYRITTSEGSDLPGSTILIPHDETLQNITYTINGISRGRTPGGNILRITVTPVIGLFRGYSTSIAHPIIGKQSVPSGPRNLNVAQQENFLLFSWQYQLTTDGFVLDIDTKEVEIRQYPGLLDLNAIESLDAAWGFSTLVGRVAFPNTSFTTPITSFGAYTFLIRVRDTSDIESEELAAASITVTRPSSIRLFKTYNDGEPGISFTSQDGNPFPTSNDYPELAFSSYSETVNGGLVMSDSSITDNSNGSAVGFAAYGNTSYLTTTNNPTATYITPIRDVGQTIVGTIRIAPIVSASNPGVTYDTFYTVVISGVTDFHGSTGLSPSANVLVDNAFGGLGHILGFNNANAAPVTYNSYHRTLTSGGPFGNVYAIRNPGQFTGDGSNANTFAYIAGVIDANSIALGNIYYANGYLSSVNTSANLTISGNSYQLVNLTQYGDEGAVITFLGPERQVTQNIFIRTSNANVYYAPEANGVTGFPGHGNVNPNTFFGAFTNAELGWKNFVPGASEFRYFQIKLELANPAPNESEIILEDLKYEVDIVQKTVRQRVQLSSVNGVTVDYSYANFYEIPQVSAIVVDSDVSQFAQAFDITKTSCNLKAYLSQNGNLSDNAIISVIVVGA